MRGFFLHASSWDLDKMFSIALTDHLEGPQDQPSTQIYEEVADLTHLADHLGVRYAFFTEHHAHIHQGHLPTPLLFALHLASQTKQIHLGTAVICANLHHPLDIAEQVAVADLLAQSRLAPGFGSGSTPEELSLFNLPQSTEQERHTQFKQTLETILNAWHPTSSTLPHPASDLPSRCFIAVNSIGAAKIAGHFNLNVLFSHLRTPAQYNQYRAAYQAAGGRLQIAANRPAYIGKDDQTAWQEAEPALRTLWRRFKQEGKIPADIKEPANPQDLCAHPINFIVGSPHSVARQLRDLHHQSPYDIANLELRWPNLSHDQVRQSLTRLMQQAMPLIASPP
ncbi:MAG: flavin-dependent oxidoreductase, F420-dependent methylene-tetrahydromethanopterin reductase [Phycisphaerales bacterium]|nr:flavin-dependent oxidoreductase, F420-dependent methylene-tetrahydromethanopterin reductase [Phycisphaerales bacterium]